LRFERSRRTRPALTASCRPGPRNWPRRLVPPLPRRQGWNPDKRRAPKTFSSGQSVTALPDERASKRLSVRQSAQWLPLVPARSIPARYCPRHRARSHTRLSEGGRKAVPKRNQFSEGCSVVKVCCGGHEVSLVPLRNSSNKTPVKNLAPKQPQVGFSF